ncbi:MAG: LysR family transcriptional regulator [Paracoccus sp. (in: a-proteobacteria)]|nr:LysR family transcriptional regulator [Paracoccus sp. (in: a-proteobacteria)]
MPQRTAIADLNWNLLRTFSVIAEEESLTGAARRLNMSQPSVSLALQRLEEQLGCQLVFRGSRHFALTLRGERIYQECAEILRGVDRIASMSADPHDEEFGSLSVSIISRLRSALIDEAIRLFHQRYPSTDIRIEVRNSLETVRQITHDKQGIGICLLTKPLPGVVCRHLFREDFAVFCGAEHPLFGRQKVSPRELAQEPFVAFSCASEGMGLEPMAILRDGLGMGRRISGSSHDLGEIRRMIIAGVGIGILPVDSVTQEVAEGLIWPLNLPDNPLGADVFLVYADEAQLSIAERKFVALLAELQELYPNMN